MRTIIKSSPKSCDSEPTTTRNVSEKPSRTASERPRKLEKEINVRRHSEVLQAVMGSNHANKSLLLAEYYRHHTLQSFDAYKRPVFPVRPPILPRDDNELIEEIRKRKASNRAIKDDRLWLEDFGRWRGSILLAESKAEGNLIVLLSMILHFDRAEFFAESFQVRRFVSNDYQIRLDDDRPRDELDVRQLARKWSLRFDVLSEAVRLEESAPRSSPARDTDPERLAQIDFESGEYRGRK